VLLGLLFVVALMGMAYAAAALLVQTTLKREREAELLFVGAEYRRAISAYFAASPPAARQFPRALEDLLRDPRYPDTRRHLRKLYADPLTRSLDWGLVKAPDGGITGVYSRSSHAPLKRANFPVGARSFAGATRYSEWLFAHDAEAVEAGAAPAAAAPASAAAGDEPAAAQGAAPPSVAARAPSSEPKLPSQCVQQLERDRAACDAVADRFGEQPYFNCVATIPGRIAACLQGRPLPALAAQP